ncbi:hypothetical protein FALBO_13028 [Fusarium albosuccineum]|uniref:Uncharacterized protein n=1 Tax=Fusarium albosuccineum TaxID=1237068 RepID=A0A8H4PGP1_9HYPO|nr:hypothetical protein FALBO_13028 [Fusarium albosuccineum]
MSLNIDPRPFTIKRVAVPGSNLNTAPMVVSCEWTEINRKNIYRYICKAEDLVNISSCLIHKDVRCYGHHMTDQNDTAWMIPFGFATGDELRYSDAAMINTAVCSGDKGPSEVSSYCFGRIKSNKGILRKQCNSTRPVNTMRCVESPMGFDDNEDMAMQMGSIVVPTEFFDKGEFLFMNEDGQFSKTKLEEGEVVAYGRCPSQGKDSALPMVVKRSTTNDPSMRVPLDVCKMNNTDFDGDEAWMSKAGSPDAIKELTEAWKRVWMKEGRVSIATKVKNIAAEMGCDSSVDPAMYTTMPLDEMGDHPGGEIYDLYMLKPGSWSVMSKTTYEESYWMSWVKRSMDGIVNSTMGKHGIGVPYTQMRDSMMMGTMVYRDQKFMRVNTFSNQSIPALRAIESMGFADCSSGLTKMTASLYQREIDMAKHGKTASSYTAVETLLKRTDTCFAYIGGDLPVINAVPVHVAESSSLPYTKLSYVAKAESPRELLGRAVNVVCMVEDLDRIVLTNEERVAVAVFIALASRSVSEVISNDSISVLKSLKTDWYTSATCTNVTWMKDILKTGLTDPTINMVTDINSLLGSLAMGNMIRYVTMCLIITKYCPKHDRDHGEIVTYCGLGITTNTSPRMCSNIKESETRTRVGCCKGEDHPSPGLSRSRTGSSTATSSSVSSSANKRIKSKDFRKKVPKTYQIISYTGDIPVNAWIYDHAKINKNNVRNCVKIMFCYVCSEINEYTTQPECDIHYRSSIEKIKSLVRLSYVGVVEVRNRCGVGIIFTDNDTFSADTLKVKLKPVATAMGSPNHTINGTTSRDADDDGDLEDDEHDTPEAVRARTTATIQRYMDMFGSATIATPRNGTIAAKGGDIDKIDSGHNDDSGFVDGHPASDGSTSDDGDHDESDDDEDEDEDDDSDDDDEEDSDDDEDE